LWRIMKRIFKGLEILIKYDPDGDTSAEHDILYASDIHPHLISDEDLSILKENGWFYDSELESWSKFT